MRAHGPTGPANRDPTHIRLLLAFVLVFALVGLSPVAGGKASKYLEVAMTVDRSEAAPGDIVAFRIFADPLREKAKNLLVTNSLPVGLHLVMTLAPRSCEETEDSWACVQADLEPLIIEIRALVQHGTEGLLLVNEATVRYGEKDPDDDEDDREDEAHPSHSGGSVTVSASVRVVSSATDPGPRIALGLSTFETVVVPGEEITFDLEITNSGSRAAHNVSVVASVSGDADVVSGFPLSSIRENRIEWYLDYLPVGVFNFLLNVSLVTTSSLAELQVIATVSYTDEWKDGLNVQTGHQSSFAVPIAVALPPPIAVATLPVGQVAAVVAAALTGLIVVQRVLALPFRGHSKGGQLFLLHRSGVVLKHYSAGRFRRADSDIVGGMLAAVRMFVQDSVDPNAGPLREIRFGGRNILFVNGENITLAAVDAHGDTDRFANDAMRFLRELEALHGHALADFDGTPERLEGIDAAFATFQKELSRRNA